MMKLRPGELKSIKYWVHLLIIAVIVFALLKMPITLMLLVKGVIILGVADIIAHTILGLE